MKSVPSEVTAFSLFDSFGKRFFSTFSLVQNKEHGLSRTQLRVMRRIIFFLSHFFPPSGKHNYVYSCSLGTMKTFKRNMLIFPDFGEFLSGVIFDPFIPQWLNHLTRLSLLIAFEGDFILQPPPSCCPMTSPLEMSFLSLPLKPVFSLPFFIKNKQKYLPRFCQLKSFVSSLYFSFDQILSVLIPISLILISFYT